MVDSIITLFESTATTFTSNGLGGLRDVMSCTVTEERNGAFELEMTYPIDGNRYSELALRRILVCKVNPYSNKQAFRIYAISKPINGVVTVNAEHISYDMSGIPVIPFEADSIAAAFGKLNSQAAVPCPFIFNTDKTGGSGFKLSKPRSMRNLLGGEEGSFLDQYGGEYIFDNYNVTLTQNRGIDRGVTIRYGKNLTDLTQEENCANTYTGCYPFYFSENDGLVQLSEKILPAEGTYNYTKIMPLDLTSDFDEPPSEGQLRDRATQYMKTNKIGIPKVSLKVSFVQLAQSEEYKNYQLLESVYIGDKVSVYFPELGVTNDKAECIKTTYDPITDKYLSIELGEATSNLASTIVSQSDKIAEAPTMSFMDKAIWNATQLLTGGLGGYVVLHNSSGSKRAQPDEILIMDTPDIKTATKVWRWNQNGLGYSKTGYNGEFGLAITADGSIVADFITSGHMLASIIRGGAMLLGGKYNGASLGDGSIEMFNDSGSRIGYWRKTGMYVSGNANITGTIHAESGDIGGWEIDDDGLVINEDDKNNRVRISCSSDKIFQIGEWDSDPKRMTYAVDYRGNVYCDDVYIRGKGWVSELNWN